MNNLSIINAISNLIKSWKKYGFKETKKKLYYNYVMLETPESMVKKRIVGNAGAMCGLIFAMLVFLFRGLILFPIIFGFSSLIMYSNLKGDLKQLQILKDLEEQFPKGDKNV